MGKILFFVLGLIGGIALSAVLYLQASTKYNSVQNTRSNSVALSQLNSAQLMWPPYFLDNSFQTKLNSLDKDSRGEGRGPMVKIYIVQESDPESIEVLTNQIEVMDGVDKVQHFTLSEPIEYIKSLTSLPSRDDNITDYILVSTDSIDSAESVQAISEVQEIVTIVDIVN